jgi:hypothetical protein
LKQAYNTQVCEQLNSWLALDAGSNKNIKEIEILLKRNWSFTYHIFIKKIERNILNLDSIFYIIMLRRY